MGINIRGCKAGLWWIGAVLILFSCLVVSQADSIQAFSDSDTIGVPILLSASESITAADFVISVTGGSFLDVDCEAGQFINVVSRNARCVVFNPRGLQVGMIARALIGIDGVGNVIVSVDGQVSTAQGKAPEDFRLEGASYKILTDSSGQLRKYGLGDINDDGIVNIFDLGILVSSFDKEDIDEKSLLRLRLSDLTEDGRVNVFDLGLFLANFRKTYLS